MELTDKDLELLDAYTHQTLSNSDKQALEQRLQSDADFAKAADEFWMIQKSLNRIKINAQRKSQLKKVNASQPPLDQSSPRINRQWILAAASISLLLMSLWWFNRNSVKVSPLLQTYLDLPRMENVGTKSTELIESRAKNAYHAKDFEKAIPAIQQAFDNDSDSIWLYYKGIAYLHNGQAKEAIPLLTSLQSFSQHSSLEANSWYLALCYIESKNNAAARKILQDLSIKTGEYAEKAKQLLSNEKFIH